MHTAVKLGESYVCFRFEPKQTKTLIYRNLSLADGHAIVLFLY